MSLGTRAVALVSVTAAALAIAGTASAAFTSPRLFAHQPETANRINLLYTQSTADDPVARVTHYIPQAYRTNLSASRRPGVIGGVTLRGSTTEAVGDVRPNSNLVLTGTVELVRADASFTVAGRSVTMTDAARACLGKGISEEGQYWLLRLQDAGQDFKWEIPVFAEREATPTDFGTDAKLTTCFAAPDVTGANRAPGGFRVREFDLRLNSVVVSPKRGQQRWSTLAAPYRPRTGVVNEQGIVELQSVVTYPRSVTIAATRTRLTPTAATYRFSGVVTTAAVDRPLVSLFRGFNRVNVGASTAQAFKIKTGAGRYTKVLNIKRAGKPQTFFFQVRAFVPNAVQGRAGCDDNYHPTFQCIQTTRAGYMIRSRNVEVRIPGL
jgi:hypothetical protein